MTRGPLARRERGSAVLAAVLLLALPGPSAALEPRFDHRDQQGPSVEALYARDFLWGSHGGSASAQRGALRVAWGFDPTGDGDEIFLGAAFTAIQRTATSAERLKLVFDARYRVCVGTEEFKTIFELGLWGSAAEKVAVGPSIGFGLMYDFTRNFGLFSSAYLGAGIGQGRVVSFGGGVGAQFRYE